MKVVIDRAKWNTGERHGCARLLDDNGYRCCLGFLGQACGYDNEDLVDVGLPSEVDPPAEHDDPGFRVDSTRWPLSLFGLAFADAEEGGPVLDWENTFAALNDAAVDIDDATREAWIAEGFRIVLGCDVEFFGEYSEAKS